MACLSGLLSAALKHGWMEALIASKVQKISTAPDLTCTFLSVPRVDGANLRSAESACAFILTTLPHRKRLDSYVRNLWRRKYTRRFWPGHV